MIWSLFNSHFKCILSLSQAACTSDTQPFGSWGMLSLFAWFLNIFKLPKGLPDKDFKKLYYCDFPCSFIPPSSNMKGIIMPLICATPPPHLSPWWAAPCQATIVLHPWGLSLNSWRLGPWKGKKGPQEPCSLVCHAKKHPSIHRSHLSAVTWVSVTLTFFLTQRDQCMEKPNFSRVKYVFRSKPCTVYSIHFKIFLENDASPAGRM